MVAKIKTGKSLIGALNYNEQKVQKGQAKLIAAIGYLKEPAHLKFHEKLDRLLDLTQRNERTKVNTLHVSLNFVTGENLSHDTLTRITEDYMDGLGFGQQPYLVYQHADAGHPHLHIVTTNIKPNGERISFHHLANDFSEPSRKAVEEKYGLVRAEDQPKQNRLLLRDLEAARYGKDELKRMITNIVSQVVRQYKFTTIGELNAVLNKYRVMADRGSKDSRMYAKEGLIYWVLDEKGNKVGVPIKASTIYGKPTLASLSEKFRLNEVLRKPCKQKLRENLDSILGAKMTERQFLFELRKRNIDAVIRKNVDGRIYGITFIDQNSKAVFNGSELGKLYSANQLSGQFFPPLTARQELHEPTMQQQLIKNLLTDATPDDLAASVADVLIASERGDLAALHKFKRKKKRKGRSL